MPKLKQLAVFLFCALCLACAPAAAPPLTPVTVQLLWTHQAQFAGLYAADQLGYYAEQGLVVTFLEGGASIDHISPVVAGRAQFGVASADELILARAQGQPVRAIATIYRRSPAVFISLTEKGLTRPQDFAGKTIRAPSNVLPTLRAMLAKAGLIPDQYQIVDLPSDLALFASGDVPVWGVYLNGFVVDARQAGYKINIVYPDDYGVHFSADTLFSTDQLLANQPDLALRFLRASLKGWAYAVENADKTPLMVQKYNPQADLAIELARMNASLALVNTGDDHIGWMNPGIWAGMEKTLREQGVLSLPLDVTQVYTLDLLQELYK